MSARAPTERGPGPLAPLIALCLLAAPPAHAQDDVPPGSAEAPEAEPAEPTPEPTPEPAPPGAPPELAAPDPVVSASAPELEPPSAELGEPRGALEETAPPASSALAERDVVTSRPGLLLGRQAAAWLELGLTRGGPAGARAIAVGGELGLRYRLADAVVAEASFGLTYAATRVRGEAPIGGTPTPYDASLDRVEPGNPILGGAVVHRDAGALVEVGLQIAIPAAAREDAGADADGLAARASSELANRAAMAMRGYRGALRFAPERFSLALPFRVALAFTPVVVELDGALAVMFPVLGDRNAQVDTLLELGVGAGVEVAGPLALGVRLAGVGAATGTTAPPFTLSAEPFARLRFDPVQITARGFLGLYGEDSLTGSRGPGFGALVGAGFEL